VIEGDVSRYIKEPEKSMSDKVVDDCIKKHRDSMGGVLSVLTGIQTAYGYLPEEALRRVAESTGRSLTEIYGVATFYRAFSLKPRGKHLISACLGTACHVRAAPRIVEELSTQLRIRPGETTPDKEFTLETVNCLGACALGPTVVVDGRYFSHVTTAGVRHIIEQARKGRQRPGADDERVFPLSAQCPKCHKSLMDRKNPVNGLQSIALDATCKGKNGPVYLSSLYGSDGMLCKCDIHDGDVAVLSCPQCGTDLRADVDCPECGATMAMLSVNGHAELNVCPRRGCPGHRLDLIAAPKAKAGKGKRA
jgi:NADH:ubiquinone oxidoreductase subunit E/ssDNA-binding Zn-finger/Zn-ribbon topoisomerase 1